MLELLKEHWGWISGIVAALAPIAGIVNLATYAHYIGRPDVFMPSLELGPGLILLWLAYILFFVLLIGSMLISSLFLSFGLSELRPKPPAAASIARVLTIITAASMFVVILPVGYQAYNGEMASAWWALLVFVIPALCSWFFIAGNIDKAESLGRVIKRWQWLWACMAFTLVVGFAALSGIYPAWFVTKFYQERGIVGGVAEAAASCLIAMVFSLAPTVGYYQLASKGRVAQIRGALGGLVVFLAVLMLMVPALLTFPSVFAVKFLGISDRQINRYLITNAEYPAENLNVELWSLSRGMERKYLIEGFALYRYGSIVLLCPSHLAGKTEKELDQLTGQCIPFAKSEVKQLNEVPQSQ
ncbi:hypothetical protein [Pseudomonas sp. NPDC012596]|uniref:hypothetical protein n=1 Tax=Pseudomonas sp. NPDC012596 TaxID=3364419 RepID=UPI0036982E9A